jgi:hypothetical protein
MTLVPKPESSACRHPMSSRTAYLQGVLTFLLTVVPPSTIIRARRKSKQIISTGCFWSLGPIAVLSIPLLNDSFGSLSGPLIIDSTLKRRPAIICSVENDRGLIQEP